MERINFRRWLIPLGIFAGVWVALRYLLPIGLPFLLGSAVALAAEPGVRFLMEKCGFSRGFSSFCVISLGFLMVLVLMWMVGAVVYRELAAMLSGLPGIFQGVSDGVTQARHWAEQMAARAPEAMRPQLLHTIGNVFNGGNLVLERSVSGAFSMAGNLMEGLPGGAMLVGTAVISSFMISAQMPSLRVRVGKTLSSRRLRKWISACSRVKTAVGGWLKAQAKLSGITFAIVASGFWILRVRNPLFWALIVALVDAVPMLGTGTILIPWCVLTLFRGDGIRAMGLAGLYVTAMLVRSALEPKVVGRQLGINPLLTLFALYAGYRIWGIGGMILAPILTVTARQLTRMGE